MVSLAFQTTSKIHFHVRGHPCAWPIGARSHTQDYCALNVRLYYTTRHKQYFAESDDPEHLIRLLFAQKGRVLRALSFWIKHGFVDWVACRVTLSSKVESTTKGTCRSTSPYSMIKNLLLNAIINSQDQIDSQSRLVAILTLTK